MGAQDQRAAGLLIELLGLFVELARAAGREDHLPDHVCEVHGELGGALLHSGPCRRELAFRSCSYVEDTRHIDGKPNNLARLSSWAVGLRSHLVRTRFMRRGCAGDVPGAMRPKVRTCCPGSILPGSDTSSQRAASESAGSKVAT